MAGNENSTFWVDPHLPRLVPYLRNCKSNEITNDDSKEHQSSRGDDFDCIFVAMWPPPLDAKVAKGQTTLRDAYSRFTNEVTKCFDPSDVIDHSSDGGLPRVYLVQPECLHITIATLHRFDVPTNLEERAIMQKLYTDLTQRASKRPNWPQGSKMRFMVDSAQIGEKAGILLWKETTGILQQMRDCVAAENAACYDDIVKAIGRDKSKSFHIPNIVHSTFMRFSDVPRTEWPDMQTKFASVKDNVKDLFGDCVVETDVVRLICDRRPYLHIPCDEDHVFVEMTL